MATRGGDNLGRIPAASGQRPKVERALDSPFAFGKIGAYQMAIVPILGIIFGPVDFLVRATEFCPDVPRAIAFLAVSITLDGDKCLLIGGGTEIISVNDRNHVEGNHLMVNCTL